MEDSTQGYIILACMATCLITGIALLIRATDKDGVRVALSLCVLSIFPPIAMLTTMFAIIIGITSLANIGFNSLSEKILKFKNIKE